MRATTVMLAAAAGLVACRSGGDQRERSADPAVAATAVDQAGFRQLEKRIAAGLHDRYGQEVRGVSCPPGGGSCVADLGASGSLTVNVSRRGDRVDAVERPVVLLHKLESVIAERYRALGHEVTVDCGGAIRASEPGTRFTCAIAGGDTVRALIATTSGRVELAYPGEPEPALPPPTDAGASPGTSTAANAAGAAAP